jgi:large subunit ribosomal protein L2
MKKNILKKIRPNTPSLRALKLLDRGFLSKKIKPIKSKSFGLKRSSGRNHKGFITIFHRGGGHKKLYRHIDFKRLDTSGVVTAIEYDSNRTSYVARVFNQKKKSFSYVLAAKNLCVGSKVESGESAEIKLGHSLALQSIPVGSLIHNLSLLSKTKGKIARAAGSYAQLIQKIKGYARLRISSGEQRLIPLNSYATLGVVSNENLKLMNLGKAGRSRWYGKRPYVRGVAMNPVDHPHGGGEGKTSGGRPSVTPWGKPTKGSKTSRSRNSLVVVSRNKK